MRRDAAEPAFQPIAHGSQRAVRGKDDQLAGLVGREGDPAAVSEGVAAFRGEGLARGEALFRQPDKAEVQGDLARDQNQLGAAFGEQVLALATVELEGEGGGAGHDVLLC